MVGTPRVLRNSDSSGSVQGSVEAVQGRDHPGGRCVVRVFLERAHAAPRLPRRRARSRWPTRRPRTGPKTRRTGLPQPITPLLGRHETGHALPEIFPMEFVCSPSGSSMKTRSPSIGGAGLDLTSLLEVEEVGAAPGVRRESGKGRSPWRGQAAGQRPGNPRIDRRHRGLRLLGNREGGLARRSRVRGGDFLKFQPRRRSAACRRCLRKFESLVSKMKQGMSIGFPR